MKTIEERLRSYEPLWENWTYTGEFLGEGAMSSVFEIQSTAMGFREVAALKIITVKKNALGKVEIPENALNEIKILRDLSGCQNIVNYHDSTQRQIFDSDNNLSEIDILIKMEKLTPLSEGSALSEEQVIKLAKDMCNALIHASGHSIIHRDIKPQNIFVDKEGVYKLGDFGIAKIVSDMSHHYTMNIGTMAYTAPEVQSSVTGVYNIASDIYSLGLVLYVYLNNGCLPFLSSSPSLQEAVSKRLSGAPFPSPANGSKSLKSIVMRACNNDTVKRYKSPQEMLEDLELLSTGGKKLVIDPFATLDANIDLTEDDIADYGTGSPVTGITPTMSGKLKINMRRRAEEKPSESVSSTSSTLKISMPKPVHKEPAAKPVSIPEKVPVPTPKVKPMINKEPVSKATAVKTPASVTPAPAEAKSRLKINMGPRTPVKGEPEKKAAEITSAAKPVLKDKAPKIEPVSKETKAPEAKAEKTDSFFSKPNSI